VRRPPSNPQRVAIIGVTGSGKSTLAARVSAATGLPWSSTDLLIWEPGWHLVDRPEQARRISEVVTGDRWVLDAVPTAADDLVRRRADLVVALDYPRWISLLRLVRRTARRVVTREEICNGNTESPRKTFSKDSILVWHFRSFARKRAEIQCLLDDPAAPPVVRLTSQEETDAWLRSLGAR
jgi:adenylate kinase family enzyme